MHDQTPTHTQWVSDRKIRGSEGSSSESSSLFLSHTLATESTKGTAYGKHKYAARTASPVCYTNISNDSPEASETPQVYHYHLAVQPVASNTSCDCVCVCLPYAIPLCMLSRNQYNQQPETRWLFKGKHISLGMMPLRL